MRQRIAEVEMATPSTDGTPFQFRYADGTLRRRAFNLDSPIQVRCCKQHDCTVTGKRKKAENMTFFGSKRIVHQH